jgi:hypothetical protein
MGPTEEEEAPMQGTHPQTYSSWQTGTAPIVESFPLTRVLDYIEQRGRRRSLAQMVTRDAPSLLLFLLLLLVPVMGGEGSVDEQPWAWGTPAAVLGSLRTFSTTLQSMFESVASRRSARGDFAGI